MPKVKKTYRIERETADKLAELAESEGITATEVIERAIRSYGLEPDGSHTVSHTADSAAITALSDELERLHGQLTAKDEQIERLGAALVAAQESVKAAQSLHAVDAAKTLALEDSETKRTRWQRLKDWFR